LLLEGEDPETYESISAQVTAAFVPRDALEQIWVRDTVEAVWECERLRRAKINLLRCLITKASRSSFSPS
jgi:hypothetical protein